MKELLSSEACCETLCMVSPPQNDSLKSKGTEQLKELALFRETYNLHNFFCLNAGHSIMIEPLHIFDREEKM